LSQDAQEALRVRGVKLLQEGVAQAEVAELLGVHERQVRRWLKRFRRGGWKALAKRKRGRDSEAQMVLSASQQARLVEAIRSCCPDQLRIPGLLWTRSAVGELIERECGVRLDLSTVGRYLRRWGFTLKRPVKRALEADPVVVEAWLADVYPQIKARAAREHGLILWQDESGVRLQHLTPQAGYAPRGVRAVARTSGKRIGTNMTSALANSGQLHFRLFEGRFTAQLFIDFLRRLIDHYPDRKVFLICDNHSTHHAKVVKTWVGERLLTDSEGGDGGVIVGGDEGARNDRTTKGQTRVRGAGAWRRFDARVAAVPVAVKRFALGPSGRPAGDRAPPLALDRNEVAGEPAPRTETLNSELDEAPEDK